MNKCIRCNKKFKDEDDHPLNLICPKCLEKDPTLSIEEKSEMNIWDNLEDFLKVFQTMKQKKWHWVYNTDCKYVELRVDMRSGHCIISNGNGKRINPTQLEWQYSKETPKMPK